MPAVAGAPYLTIGSTKRPARAISVHAMSRRCRVVNCSDSTMLSRSSPVYAGFALQVGGQRVDVDGLRARQRGHDVDRGVGVVQGRAHGVVDRRGQGFLTVRAVAVGVLPLRA